MTEFISRIDSQSPEYERIFGTFLRYTDQKEVTGRWLQQCAAGLSRRDLLIDAGAGEGKLTALLSGDFQRTIAVEPNEELRKKLAAACPDAKVVGSAILEAPIEDGLADMVLCSHVLYYIPDALWLKHLEKMVAWTCSEGLLVVLLQSTQSDCLRMGTRFGGEPDNLRPLAEAFRSRHADTHVVEVCEILAYVTTQDFASAYLIAEFMLTNTRLPRPVKRVELEAYVETNFACDRGYRFSCTQDCLQIRARN